MEEWIGGKGIEGKCRENESHEMWSWSPESSCIPESTLVGCVVRVLMPTL